MVARRRRRRRNHAAHRTMTPPSVLFYSVLLSASLCLSFFPLILFPFFSVSMSSILFFLHFCFLRVCFLHHYVYVFLSFLNYFLHQNSFCLSSLVLSFPPFSHHSCIASIFFCILCSNSIFCFLSTLGLLLCLSLLYWLCLILPSSFHSLLHHPSLRKQKKGIRRNEVKEGRKYIL